MNTNRIAQYLVPAGHLGTFPEKANSDDEFGIINVSGLYDSSRHRALATRCLARIARKIGPTARVHSDWWSLDTFQETTSYRLAVKAGKSSSILWFACDHGDTQIQILQSWVEECAGNAGWPQALVALVEGRTANPVSAIRLQTLARDRQLDLFMERAATVSETRNSSPTLYHCHCPTFDPAIFSLAANHSQIRFWGINE